MALAFLSGLPEFTSKSYGQVIQFQVIEMNIVSDRTSYYLRIQTVEYKI